jgi:hypothetical protein
MTIYYHRMLIKEASQMLMMVLLAVGVMESPRRVFIRRYRNGNEGLDRFATITLAMLFRGKDFYCRL